MITNIYILKYTIYSQLSTWDLKIHVQSKRYGKKLKKIVNRLFGCRRHASGTDAGEWGALTVADPHRMCAMWSNLTHELLL